MQKKLAMQVNTGKLVHPALYLNGAPGIDKERKEGIINNLLSVIPINRRKFWLDLEVGYASRKDDSVEE